MAVSRSSVYALLLTSLGHFGAGTIAMSTSRLAAVAINSVSLHVCDVTMLHDVKVASHVSVCG